jgi:hypothetical protein
MNRCDATDSFTGLKDKAMNRSRSWRLGLVAVAFAVGFSALPAMVHAQDNAQGQGERPRRGRGQAQGGAGGGAAGGARAQTPVRAVDQLREQVNALTLKDDQKSRLDGIFKEAAEQAKSLETEVQSMQPRERAQKIQPFNRALRDKVMAVLDEEQKQTLRKKAAERQGQQMTERWKRALGQLSLSGDQQAKADAVLADAQKKLAQQSAEGEAAAGQGRGGPGGGPNAAVARETRQKIDEILTADQKQKLAEIMPERGGRGRGGQGGAGAPGGGAGGRRRGQNAPRQV